MQKKSANLANICKDTILHEQLVLEMFNTSSILKQTGLHIPQFHLPDLQASPNPRQINL